LIDLNFITNQLSSEAFNFTACCSRQLRLRYNTSRVRQTGPTDRPPQKCRVLCEEREPVCLLVKTQTGFSRLHSSHIWHSISTRTISYIYPLSTGFDTDALKLSKSKPLRTYSTKTGTYTAAIHYIRGGQPRADALRAHGHFRCCASSLRTVVAAVAAERISLLLRWWR